MNKSIKTSLIIISIIIIISLFIYIMLIFNSRNKSNLITNNINNNKEMGNITNDISIANISIEILENTVTKTGVTILVKNLSETNYNWDKYFRVQKKVEKGWQDVETKANVDFTEESIISNNKQFTENLEWNILYGELQTGIYRIVKRAYNNGYIEVYSNAFEIK